MEMVGGGRLWGSRLLGADLPPPPAIPSSLGPTPCTRLELSAQIGA